MDLITYSDVVFLQGEEATPVIDALYRVEGCVAHGMTAETIAAAVAYLAQWDNGDEPAEYRTSLNAGTADVHLTDDSYVLTSSLHLNHVGLSRLHKGTPR